MKKTLLIVVVVVLALAALGAGAAFAQGGTPPVGTFGYGRGMMDGGAYGYGMMNNYGGYGAMHDYVEQALAAKLSLTEAQVEQELATKPMYQIALDHGIAQADLAAFMNDIHKTAFAAAVKDGVLTQAQADFMLQRMQQNGYGYGYGSGCPMWDGDENAPAGTGPGRGYGRGMMSGGRWQSQSQ